MIFQKLYQSTNTWKNEPDQQEIQDFSYTYQKEVIYNN